MPPLRWLTAWACGSFSLYATGALPWPLPAVDGELAGNFRPLKAAEAPTLHWQLTLRTDTKTHLRIADVGVDGPGAKLAGAVQVNAKGEGTWRVTEARVDAGIWLAALASLLPAAASGVTMQGNVTFSGDGTLHEGVFDGRATTTLRGGRIDDSTLKLVLEGVTLDLAVEDFSEPRTAPKQTITWTGGHYDVIQLGAGRVSFALAGDELRVDEATLSVLGGQLVAGPLTISLSRPEFSADARIQGADITLILPLLPPILAEADGRLDGHLTLRRDADGLHIGTGRLTVPAGQTAQVRLLPSPGLLSSSLPPKVLQYYPGLKKIETGETPLRAYDFEINFTPDGDADGRTALVHLAGGPVDPKLKAPIDLTINIHGPLDTLVKFGTDSRLHFGGKR